MGTGIIACTATVSPVLPRHSSDLNPRVVPHRDVAVECLSRPPAVLRLGLPHRPEEKQELGPAIRARGEAGLVRDQGGDRGGGERCIAS